MIITITVTSILVIALVAWLANRVLPFEVCPICAGVFLTWVGLLGAYFAGYPIPLTIPALLMGGSVVGIAYQLEKKFRDLPVGKILFWKILFIPTGFVVAYGILEQLPAVFLIAAVFLLVSLSLLSSGSIVRRTEIDNIEKKMENCC